MSTSDLTAGEILQRAEELIGSTIEFNTARNWINQCSREHINPKAKLQAYRLIAPVPNTTVYSLPDNMWENDIIAITINSKPGFLYGFYDEIDAQGYKLWDGKLEVSTPSSIGIWYHRRMVPVEISSDKPDIPNDYRHLYVYYLCIKYQKQDEELELQSSYESDFYAALQVFEKERNKYSGRTRTKQWGVSRR